MNFAGCILCPKRIILIWKMLLAWCCWPEKVHYIITLSGIHNHTDLLCSNIKKQFFIFHL